MRKLAAFLMCAVAPAAFGADAAAPLALGESFTLQSKTLNETRRINVYAAPAWGEAKDAKRPVLYMPDGGAAEDFFHVAGLLQVSIGNGTMRPFLLVGIENTQRRRDLTGPTRSDADKKIAPVVGGSAAFRAFIRDELKPEIARRYRITGESAIVGESLAGLFTVETFLLEPTLFDTYIAFDPSLGWDEESLVSGASARLRARPDLKKSLWLASGDEPTIVAPTQRLAAVLTADAPKGLNWHHERLPDEHHSTIYHPAALRAFRALFAPQPEPGAPTSAAPVAASAYVGQQSRPIKSLSAEDIEGYLAGRGMGLAKAAELNGYPGPAHVLELADKLGLSAAQRRSTEAILAAMRSEAVALGRALIDEEAALDRSFVDRSVTASSLATALERIAALQAKLRGVHLEAHLAQGRVLTPAQRSRYAELRGYADAAPHNGHH